MAKDGPSFLDRQRPDTLVLFDVDGTLTAARKTILPDVLDALEKLRRVAVIGFVGGSDLAKQKEQLGDDVLNCFDYAFAENGLEAYCNGKEIATQSFIGHIGEERYKKLVNWILHYIADLDIPIKRGTFVEFRNGMINVSPIGRNCSYPERVAFEKFDHEHGIRKTMVAKLKEAFADFSLTYSIGGQISFDVFPTGWDKTYCLRHVEQAGFKEIHFFGDKTYQGGNDYEIYTHPKVKGHSVKSPQESIAILNELFGI